MRTPEKDTALLKERERLEYYWTEAGFEHPAGLQRRRETEHSEAQICKVIFLFGRTKTQGSADERCSFGLQTHDLHVVLLEWTRPMMMPRFDRLWKRFSGICTSKLFSKFVFIELRRKLFIASRIFIQKLFIFFKTTKREKSLSNYITDQLVTAGALMKSEVTSIWDWTEDEMDILRPDDQLRKI